MIRSLAHVALQVTDLEASVRYASEVLGMREVERVDGRAYLTALTQCSRMLDSYISTRTQPG
jgi:catechol 2,3-dioxygenase-like lactoylglutathione lyase family enzyme